MPDSVITEMTEGKYRSASTYVYLCMNIRIPSSRNHIYSNARISSKYNGIIPLSISSE